MMGLDITAHAHARLMSRHTQNDLCWNNHIRVEREVPFPDSLGGLVAGRCYKASGETLHVHAGSYGGYNAWRGALSRAALGVEPREVWDDPTAFAGRPFVLLVNFSDCEGEIGPEACATLAAEFAAHRETVAAALAAEADWYAEKYDEWQAAFELAAGTGLVEFH